MEQRVGHFGKCIGWQRHEVIWKVGPLAKVRVSRADRWGRVGGIEIMGRMEVREELWLGKVGMPRFRLNFVWVRWLRAGLLAGIAVVLALIWR